MLFMVDEKYPVSTMPEKTAWSYPKRTNAHSQAIMMAICVGRPRLNIFACIGIKTAGSHLKLMEVERGGTEKVPLKTYTKSKEKPLLSRTKTFVLRFSNVRTNSILALTGTWRSFFLAFFVDKMGPEKLTTWRSRGLEILMMIMIAISLSFKGINKHDSTSSAAVDFFVADC